MVSSARNPNESYAQRAKRATSSTSTTTTTRTRKDRNDEQRSPDLSSQLAILDQQDEHDPFVVRVPPHLSRQSSSSNTTDHSGWPQLPSADRDRQPALTPALSPAPSRQNSTASFRHHAYSSSGSVRLSVQSSLSQHSHSASHSAAQSRSGSSASSPRLQIRGRTLPQEDILPDLRLDPHRRSSHQRSSPALPDPPNHTSSFHTDPPPSDPVYYPPPPPPQDMPRYTHFIPQYLTQQFSPTHIPGHSSPPYIPHHSGQGTPPYPHYPPFPAYMYGHPPPFWRDLAPPHSHNHFQNQTLISSNYITASEHPVPHTTELGSMSPVITVEPPASKGTAQRQNGWQPKSSKNVVFGTIDLADFQAEPVVTEQRSDPTVEHAIEQFAVFSIGVDPDEHGPSRLGSRKSSARSLSRSLSQPIPNGGEKEANVPPLPSRQLNGIKHPIKWEFGTTQSEDLDDAPPSPPSPPSCPSSNEMGKSDSEKVEDQPDLVNVPPVHDTAQADRSMDRSETGSHASDVWVVKDYGYGFGDPSGPADAPNGTRWGTRERDKERARDQHRDRGWLPARQSGWRHENGQEESWEQQGLNETPRHNRPRRGSFQGYGGHERGGFPGRRGRGFGGRFHGGRGRGFFHHRPGSYSFAPHPLPSLPFEVVQPTIDMVNGYGPSYAPELESYEALSPVHPHMPFTTTAYSLEAMQNCLLGQLEYYLSRENMIQDYFLRQRMDHEGWIPISLLASFKRVKQLHMDADVVREVLSRSRLVETSGDWVRMGGGQWKSFVLPDAPRSMVSGFDRAQDKSPGPGVYQDGVYGEIDGEHGETEGDCEGDDCEGDDEDDDVEFVIGEEAEGSWMSVTERKQ